MNPKHIYYDYVKTDIKYDKVKDLCIRCLKDNYYGFFVFDKDEIRNKGPYRKGFNCLININD